MRSGSSICLLVLLLALPAGAASGSEQLGLSIDDASGPNPAARSADPSLRLYSMQPAGLVRQRCLPRSRNLLRIGHGAGTDGRPEGCRGLGWNMLRTWRRDWLIGAFRTRALPTLRELDVLMWAWTYNPVRPIQLSRPRNIHAVFADRRQ